jgi:hypothetical protein
LVNWSISLRPGKSGSLFTSSAKMHPIDHMSIAVVYCLVPSNNSGALNQKEAEYGNWKQNDR